MSAAPVVPADAKAPRPSLVEKVKAFIIKNYLPLAFLVALGLALAWPVPGRFLAELSVLGNVRIVQVTAMALVFLITGLQLNTAELKRALAVRNLPVVVYGFVAILVATPCLGFALREAPLTPREFATGLTIFAVAPTTLGVGVALTEACGGNRAMALLLTVGTNALAVFTMPPELRLLLPSSDSLGDGGGVEDVDGALNMDFKVGDLLVKLAVTVLVPFAIGKAAREIWPSVAAFAKEHRVALSLTSTTSLAFVVWQTLSAARDTLLEQDPGPVFAMMGLAVAMHLAYLLANYVLVWFVLRPTLREAIAVVIMSSQKSAPVAVTAITFMTTNAAQQGLLSLPSIVGQLWQIFIGAALAKWLARVVKRAEAREAAEAEAKAAAEAAVQVAVIPSASGGGGGGDVEAPVLPDLSGPSSRGPQPEPGAPWEPLGRCALTEGSIAGGEATSGGIGDGREASGAAACKAGGEGDGGDVNGGEVSRRRALDADVGAGVGAVGAAGVGTDADVVADAGGDGAERRAGSEAAGSEVQRRPSRQ